MDNNQDDEVLVNLGASVEKESITTKSKYHKILIKTLELFLTVSALSVLLSSFTGLSYLHPYTYYFSTFLFPFQTQALQRKYMFLLCNGILVFLASMSGFWGALSSSSKTREELSVGNNAQGVMMTTEDDAEAIVLQAAAAVDPLFEEGAPAGASRVETNVGFPHSRVAAAAAAAAVAEEEEEEKKKADEQFGEDWIEDRGLEENEEMVCRPKMIGEEGGEYDEMESEDPGSINTEELNRKIEEFIRKMKEELRLEAQQHHLIAV